MKTNTIIVLGCLLFVLALAAIGAEAARGDYEDRRGSGGSGADYGGGRSGGGYDDEEDQDFGRGGSNYPAPIEPEVTKVVTKCGEDSLKVKFQWDFFIFLKIMPLVWTQAGLTQASMAA